MSRTTIAIVGAGFSGTLLSLHVLRRCPPCTRVVLIERGGQFGRGQAYATGNPSHVLNVPAARMSAFHDRPTHFLDWLGAQGKCRGDGSPVTGGCFVPRREFGAYVRHLLKEELRRPGLGGRLDLVRGEVVGLEACPDRLTLRFDRDRRGLTADLAVLAVGNFPSEPPPVPDPSFYDGPLYHPDPWAPDALAGLDPEAPVLLIGTGLTMVDVVVSLLDADHRGPIHALSRRGLLPHRHGAAAGSSPKEPRSYPTALGALARFLRAEARRGVEAGGTWQPVIDDLRPFVQDVWQAMSAADRARFLRHLRPWWDVHRHRMAPAVANRIGAARARGQLRIHAGRIQGFAEADGAARVRFRPRGGDRIEELAVARVVNCSGPGADYDRIAHPLVRALLRDGLVRPDPLRLGLDVTGTCALLDRQGAISRRLFAVGPATKGAFWEMTAVPDIRRQCEFLAAHLVTVIKPRPPQPVPAPAAEPALA